MAFWVVAAATVGNFLTSSGSKLDTPLALIQMPVGDGRTSSDKTNSPCDRWE
jgi:hypothetical protein